MPKRLYRECLMKCGENARLMPRTQDRKGSCREPVFCSPKCATTWAHLHVRDIVHHCIVTNDWQLGTSGDCMNDCARRIKIQQGESS